MPKPISRAYSRYSRDAAQLLGQMIRLGRMNRKLTLAELAERTGVSRGLIQRIERGDMGCAIGAVFEVAAIVLVQSSGNLLDSGYHLLCKAVVVVLRRRGGYLGPLSAAPGFVALCLRQAL